MTVKNRRKSCLGIFLLHPMVSELLQQYLVEMLTLFEPQHEISNNVVCATSKASDQPAHTRSLI